MRPVGGAAVASARRRSLVVADQGPFLVPSGSPTFVAGKFGNALSPNNGWLGTTEAVAGNLRAFTLEAWAYTPGTGSGYTVVFEGTGATTANRLSMGTYNNKTWFYVGTANYNYDTYTFTAGWHHLCIMANNGTVRVYVDGVVRTSFTGSNMAINWTAFRLGAAVAGTQIFPGLIDEFRLSLGQRYDFSGAAFTPPANPFQIDANTVLLYHLNKLES